MKETEQADEPFYRTFLGRWLFLVLPLGTLSAVLCRYWVDLPVAHWCWLRRFQIDGLAYPKHVPNLLVLAESFGTWSGMLIVTVLILELDYSRRRRLFRYFTSIFWAGLIVNLMKLFITRIRPRGFRFCDPDLVQQHNTISIDWTPWDSAFRSVEGSFPSGHTAVAFATCVVLSFLYPKGKRIFLMLAILVGAQRILACAHFPSDVIVGAMIGLLVGGICTAFSPLARFCDQLESPKLRQPDSSAEERKEP